jgi:hypothetical protein
MREVNSTLAGLGVSCSPIHKAVNTLKSATCRVFMRPLGFWLDNPARLYITIPINGPQQHKHEENLVERS